MMVEVDGVKLAIFILGIRERIEWLQTCVSKMEQYHIDTFDVENEIWYRGEELAEIMAIIPDEVKDYVNNYDDMIANVPF